MVTGQTDPPQKTLRDLRGYFAHFKDDDAGGLTPGKGENTEMRKIDRKDAMVFVEDQSMCHAAVPPINRAPPFIIAHFLPYSNFCSKIERGKLVPHKGVHIQ